MRKESLFVLDTNICTEYFKKNEFILRRMKAASGPIAITVVTYIEVLKGRFDNLLKAANGSELKTAMSRLDQSTTLLGELNILPVDDPAVEEFERLRKNKKLKKIGRADLLIASIVLGHQTNQERTLVTRNLKHFKQVPRLKVVNWAD